MCGPVARFWVCVPGMPKDGAQRCGYSDYDLLRPLIAEANAERARSANEIPIGTHGF
jgi:hypothetical protein